MSMFVYSYLFLVKLIDLVIWGIFDLCFSRVLFVFLEGRGVKGGCLWVNVEEV